jgi:rhodanese-related sulfurtransferase
MKNLYNNILIIFLLFISFFANAQIHKNITAVQADSLINANANNPNFTILDVRTPTEFATGHLINALNIDYFSSTFTQQINALNKNNKYLVHCKSGSRSPKAIDTMKMLGFIETYNMIGGINAWKAAGFQIITKTDDIVSGDDYYTIYPNPANGFIVLIAENDDSSEKKVNIFNFSGKLERTCDISYNDNIYIGDLKNGTYLLQIITEHSIKTSKLVILK